MFYSMCKSMRNKVSASSIRETKDLEDRINDTDVYLSVLTERVKVLTTISHMIDESIYKAVCQCEADTLKQ